jgi:hypothetical protein
MDEFFALAIFFGLIFYCTFWLAQLLDLMRRRDDEFPARFDKPLWVAIILFLPILGAVAYSIWKPKIYPSGSKLQSEWEAIQAQRRKNPTPEKPA